MFEQGDTAITASDTTATTRKGSMYIKNVFK